MFELLIPSPPSYKTEPSITIYFSQRQFIEHLTDGGTDVFRSPIMQRMKNAILRHARVKISTERLVIKKNDHVLKQLVCRFCTSTTSNSDQVNDRVIELVKQFNRIDASKVTRTADFQKDLSLDSLDKVELVMAFEQEFSIEIPEEKADKFTCCDDVAKYIVSSVEEKKGEKS